MTEPVNPYATPSTERVPNGGPAHYAAPKRYLLISLAVLSMLAGFYPAVASLQHGSAAKGILAAFDLVSATRSVVVRHGPARVGQSSDVLVPLVSDLSWSDHHIADPFSHHTRCPGFEMDRNRDGLFDANHAPLHCRICVEQSGATMKRQVVNWPTHKSVAYWNAKSCWNPMETNGWHQCLHDRADDSGMLGGDIDVGREFPDTSRRMSHTTRYDLDGNC